MQKYRKCKQNGIPCQFLLIANDSGSEYNQIMQSARNFVQINK